MVAAAASIAVVYPAHELDRRRRVLADPRTRRITARDRRLRCRGAQVTPAFYRDRGLDDHSVPRRQSPRTPWPARFPAGRSRSNASSEVLGGRLPLARLLADAIHYARHGIAVTRSQQTTTAAKLDGPARAARLRRNVPRRRATCRASGTLFLPAAHGRDARSSWRRRDSTTSTAAISRGRLRAISPRAGSPLVADDLRSHRAAWRKPLALSTRVGTLYNLPPPTQGVVSLLILGILDALDIGATDPDERGLRAPAASRRSSRRSPCATATSPIPPT